MKKIIMLGVALLTAGALLAGELDGTKWKIKATPDAEAKAAGEKSFKDSLSFQDNKVTMSECMKYGFGPSTYQASKNDGGSTWSTDQTSDKKGTMHWDGTTHDDKTDGSILSTKMDGKQHKYNFTGSKVK